MAAFAASFDAGFGTETDVRDNGRGDLVISHDPPCGGEASLDEFLELAEGYDLGKHSIALNIKADGLADRVERLLAAHPRVSAFVFDMAVPDMRAYVASSIDTYGRLSDAEPTLPWPESLDGIWLDAFDEQWFGVDHLRTWARQLPVCIVSPELHGRDPEPLWSLLAELRDELAITVCTDNPNDLARRLEART